jgi:hypothetical protein
MPNEEEEDSLDPFRTVNDQRPLRIIALPCIGRPGPFRYHLHFSLSNDKVFTRPEDELCSLPRV